MKIANCIANDNKNQRSSSAATMFHTIEVFLASVSLRERLNSIISNTESNLVINSLSMQQLRELLRYSFPMVTLEGDADLTMFTDFQKIKFIIFAYIRKALAGVKEKEEDFEKQSIFVRTQVKETEYYESVLFTVTNEFVGIIEKEEEGQDEVKEEHNPVEDYPLEQYENRVLALYLQKLGPEYGWDVIRR